MRTLSFVTLFLCNSVGMLFGSGCPEHCVCPQGSDKCASCRPGYYNTICGAECNDPNCLNNECDRTNGWCKGTCKPGWIYQKYQKLCYQCPPHCSSCHGNTLMLEYCGTCKPDFNGQYCRINCTGCVRNQCSKTQCLFGCQDGYFTNPKLNLTKLNPIPVGEWRQIPNDAFCYKCMGNCRKCTDIRKCTSCIPGTYGQVCDHTCDPKCKNRVCTQDTGMCEQGCEAGYYADGKICVTCPSCDKCGTDRCKAPCCGGKKQPTRTRVTSTVTTQQPTTTRVTTDGTTHPPTTTRVTTRHTTQTHGPIKNITIITKPTRPITTPVTSTTVKPIDKIIVIGSVFGGVFVLLMGFVAVMLAIFVIGHYRSQAETRYSAYAGERTYLNDDSIRTAPYVVGHVRETHVNSRQTTETTESINNSYRRTYENSSHYYDCVD